MGKAKREIPHFHTPLVETHCHLDYLKSLPLAEIIQKCHEKGIEKIITISVEPSNFSLVRELANKYDHVFCSQGVHPHRAKLWDDLVKKEIEQQAQKSSLKKIVAIGEIGLDFYYNHSSREKQQKAFAAQLEIACQYNLPVIIHSREADKETMEILKQFIPQLSQKGVIHSFTSSQELAEFALDAGFCLGFNGIITFKNAIQVQEIVKLCPLHKILLETDAPFLTPVPYRGQENAPYYLPFVAEKIAELKELSVQEVIEKTSANAYKLFQL